MGDPVRVAGTMSGTSLDGVDAAVIETDGERVAAFGPVAFRPYTEAERETLRAALGRWPGAPGVAEADAVVERAHVEALAGLSEEAEVVAFHGQTLAHDPGGRGTHQAGDGARLADRLGRAVVWDFRSADVAAGGQGAPLAPAWHFALARRIGGDAPLAFLNLGGVGNLTWADPRKGAPEAPGAIAAFDTGPANAPVNDLMRARRGVAQDAGGALAATGRADETVLARFLADPYFARPAPKSLDRDAFAALLPAVAHLGDADAAATLTEAAARAVAAGLAQLPVPPARLLVTGGGRHNGEMMRRIAAQAACPVAPVEEAGLDGDMLEAQAFAFLAVRVLRGLPTSFPATTGAPRPICGGRVSRPGA